MKNLTFFVCLLFGQLSYTQSIPRVADIYKFSVGDTFEYKAGDSSICERYTIKVIPGKADSCPALVAYTERISTCWAWVPNP